MRWPAFLFLSIFVLLFLLIILMPSQCNNSSSTLYGHCDNMRYYGITCTPDNNCWYNVHYAPGPNGAAILFILMLCFVSFFICFPTTNDYVAIGEKPRRKKRIF